MPQVTCRCRPDAMLYVFSNGVAELGNGAQGKTGVEAFIDLLSAPLDDGAADIERLKSQAQGLARGAFGFDLSILRVDFCHRGASPSDSPTRSLAKLAREIRSSRQSAPAAGSCRPCRRR